MATSKKRRNRGGTTSTTASNRTATNGGRSAAPSEIQDEGRAGDLASYGVTEADLQAEYGYVRKDLRHLAVVSVILFVGMVAVGFLMQWV